MKTKVLVLSGVLFFMLSLVLTAQDQIHKRNNEVINCKIKEIGTEEVKYILPDYPEDVLFSIDNDKILKVVFENGKEKYFQKEMTNPENYVDNAKNAIKFDFISPLTGNTTFAYEHSLKPGRSIEATLGIIGLGIDPGDIRPRGTFVKFGYKFIKSPDFYFNRMRYAHLMKGFYIKPEVSLACYSRDAYGECWGCDDPGREAVYSIAAQMVFGIQWVFGNVFLVDLSAGVGYGFDNIAGGYHFGFAAAPIEFPVSGSASIKIGYLF